MAPAAIDAGRALDAGHALRRSGRGHSGAEPKLAHPAAAKAVQAPVRAHNHADHP